MSTISHSHAALAVLGTTLLGSMLIAFYNPVTVSAHWYTGFTLVGYGGALASFFVSYK